MQVQTLRLYHQVIQLNYSDAYIIKRKEINIMISLKICSREQENGALGKSRDRLLPRPH